MERCLCFVERPLICHEVHFVFSDEVDGVGVVFVGFADLDVQVDEGSVEGEAWFLQNLEEQKPSNIEHLRSKLDLLRHQIHGLYRPLCIYLFLMSFIQLKCMILLLVDHILPDIRKE